MSKFKFIQNLLENEKFNLSQKERFFKLVSKELESSSEFDTKVLEDIKLIKEKIGLIDAEDSNTNAKFMHVELHRLANDDITNIKKNEAISTEVNLPKHINPINLSNFLKEYNQHPILKYTCHLIDSEDVIKDINNNCNVKEYNYSKHLNLVIEAFHSLRKTHFINYKIVNLILVYLTGESYSGKDKIWSTDGIKYNWSSIEMLQWSIDNPKIILNPGLNIKRLQSNNGYSFQGFKSNIFDVRIRTFSELVIHFKNLFHLKGDNSLLQLIKTINDKNKWNEKIDFNIVREDFNPLEFRENIELFTDIDSLKKGYIEIIKQAIESSVDQIKPIINLSFKSDNEGVEFSIHHINSKITKKSAEDLILRLGESHKNAIKNLNGVCDIYLCAEYSYNQYSEINLWNKEKRKAIPLPTFKGVKHILKFK
jgi:hypothetical protein